MLAWHGEFDESICDQRDESQWDYYVIRSDDLPERQKTISLGRIRQLVEPTNAANLKDAVERT